MKYTESGFALDSSDNIYLTDVSPKDKPWDVHRFQATRVKSLYRGTPYDKYADRIDSCSGLLEFGFVLNPETAEISLKLETVRFCRVRHCPVCQWRRQLVWRARFFQAFPKLRSQFPTARFVFLTLTLKNCQLAELRTTLTWMNKSWERLSKRKAFPALGWLRSVEVTKSQDGTAHPHFHVLLMVPSSYFSHGYISQSKWAVMWQESLRVEYTPIVNVKAVKPKKGATEDRFADELAKALCETLKYSVKPDDLVSDRDWLIELTTQLHKTRAVAVGGVFKEFISDQEPEDLIHLDDENTDLSPENSVWFGWREMIGRYLKCQGSGNSSLSKDS